MIVPSKHQCFGLIHELKTLDHIVAHSIQVCRVALLITDGLMETLPCLNRDLVQAAGAAPRHHQNPKSDNG